MQIEKRYTKREIFTLYANQINLGHGAYGVEAASRAVLRQVREGPDARGGRDDRRDHPDAGAAQPVRQPRPHAGPAQQLRAAADGRRRLHHREAGRRGARRGPLVAAGTAARRIARSHPYFVEDIRKSSSRSTAPTRCTRPACACRRRSTPICRRPPTRASIAACAGIDKRRSGYPQAGAQRASPKGSTLEAFTIERWSQPILAGDIVPAVVTSCRRRAAAARASASAQTRSSCRRRRSPGRGKTSAARSVQGRRRDRGRGAQRSKASGRSELTLEQPPAVEGALLAIDNRTGQIRAMVGGFSFARSKFNRATQARRQVGSLFKPIVYTTAIDRGFTPVSVFIDEPVSYDAGPEPAAVSAAELRPQVRRAGHAAPRARAVAQHSGGEGDAGDRAAASRGLREALRT